jgi:DNA-binding transcriptional ArsR family regulator
MEESLFIRELGIKSPMLKILDFLMDNEAFDYSRAEIEEGAGLSKTTLLKVWPKLEDLELVKTTRTVGKAKMYKLNKQNPIIKKLMDLDDAISEYYAQKYCSSAATSGEEVSEIDRRDRSKELLIA